MVCFPYILIVCHWCHPETSMDMTPEAETGSMCINRVKQCIRYELIHYLNELPNIITDKVHTHSSKGFSLYIKQYLLNPYENSCRIPNCYVCNPPV